MLKKISIRNFSVSDEPCRMDMLDVIPVPVSVKKTVQTAKPIPKAINSHIAAWANNRGKMFFSHSVFILTVPYLIAGTAGNDLSACLPHNSSLA